MLEPKMHMIGTDNIVYVDIDNTLIYWNKVPKEYKDNMIGINSHVYYYNSHTLTQIEEHSRRGHSVILWSAGGVEWAWSVAIALKLHGYVDAVMCKPKWIIDDKQPEEWMPEARYYGYREPHWED